MKFTKIARGLLAGALGTILPWGGAEAGLLLSTDAGVAMENGLTRWTVSMTSDTWPIGGVEVAIHSAQGLNQQWLGATKTLFQDYNLLLDLLEMPSDQDSQFMFHSSQLLIISRDDITYENEQTMAMAVGINPTIQSGPLAQVVVPTGSTFTISGIVALMRPDPRKSPWVEALEYTFSAVIGGSVASSVESSPVQAQTPLPGAAWAGLALMGAWGAAGRTRNRRRDAF